MKTKSLIVMLFALCLFIAEGQAQNQNTTKKHYLNFGPQVSYNFKRENTLLGIGAGYEYRLTPQWGLAANVSFNQGIKNNGVAIFANSSGVHLLKIANQGISVGGKFYLQRFYLSADWGYGEERQKLQYADGRGTRWEKNPGLYQNYGIGYQIPTRNNILEIFASGNGIKDLKITSGLRFNFRLN